MSDPARRKEKQRLKRKEKQRQLHRAKNISPARIFAQAAERGLPLECYCNPDWRQEGMLGIQCIRQTPNGGHAMVAFLIDVWCLGLKDAWGRLDITRQEFHDRILEPAKERMGCERMDEAEALRMVAGSVRMAMDNGFRLPPRWERWVSLLGDIGDPAQADLSEFRVDGKLRFVGNYEDLRKRLIFGTPEEFFAREDAEVIISDMAPDLFDEDEAALDDGVRQTEEKAINTIRQWLFANGHAPHPRLGDALNLFMESILLSDAKDDDDVPARAERAMEVFTSTMSPEERTEFAAAHAQILLFAQQFADGEAFAEAIGITEDELE